MNDEQLDQRFFAACVHYAIQNGASAELNFPDLIKVKANRRRGRDGRPYIDSWNVPGVTTPTKEDLKSYTTTAVDNSRVQSVAASTVGPDTDLHMYLIRKLYRKHNLTDAAARAEMITDITSYYNRS